MSVGLLTQVRYWADLTLGRIQPLTDSHRRYVRILQASSTAFLGRGLALFVGFISVPLTIGYLGNERYGAWIAISTFLAWFQIADLGLGNGLTNAVSYAYGKNQPALARSSIATTFWMLVAFALVIAAIAFIFTPYIYWVDVFNVKSEVARVELQPAVLLAILLTLANLPLSVVEKVLNGFQEGAYSNYWAAAASVASLIGILFVTRSEGGLPALVIGYSGTILLVRFVSALWLFLLHKPELFPNVAHFDRKQLRALGTTGIEFFFLQIAALVLFQSDNLVIAHYLGAESVPEYSVTYKLFSYVTLIHLLFITPLWPAYGEASAKGEWNWVASTLKRSLLLSMTVFPIIVLLLVVIAKPLIGIWTAGAVHPDELLIVLIAVWTMLSVWGGTFGYLLNGIGHIRIQAIVACVMAVINIYLSITWVQLYGIAGVIGATVITYLFITSWITPLDACLTIAKNRRKVLNNG